MAEHINTLERSEHLRNKGVDLETRKVLITSFRETEQSKDITLSYNCNGYGRIHHFRRESDTFFPPNSLPIDPASRALGLPYEDLIKVQVFQNAICSWRCWYCFVDYSLLNANMKRSSFLSADDLIDFYLDEDFKSPIIDLSGGQPDLVPEWVLWFIDALVARGLSQKVYLWSDDNLSNDYLWKHLTKQELVRIASYPMYGRVGCFKGFDPNSFSFNTKARPELFYNQFQIMKRLIATGIDMYGYITLTSNTDKDLGRNISNLIDKLQEEVHPLFPLRTIPLQIKEFTPTLSRMKEDHYRSLEIQKDAVMCWNNELQNRFSKQELSKRIFEHKLY
ncbi:hypothetical protein ACSX1A_17495 [Pontibacter sp. MBLB2868]|uniref:hypothetical protein n=1 Tax=Pontibacter sp. MBLB2868 TaxID=3451555 RepID=UPI003F752E18